MKRQSARQTRPARSSGSGAATVGCEAQLWQMADALRGSMDAAEYKHVVLGRVYEYFLSRFASAEGKKGGAFYTPRCMVKLMVEMLEPYRRHRGEPEGVGVCRATGLLFIEKAASLNS